MDWTPLVSTASGAALALGGTLLAHVLTSRDRRGRENRNARRKSYLEFMLAVESAHARLRRLADPNHPPDDVVLATREAVTDSGVYSAREKLLVTAEPALIQAAERTLRTLGLMRDAIRAGAKLNTQPYHDVYHQHAEAVWALRRAARRDLGAGPITPGDVSKDSWDARENCRFCRNHDAGLPDAGPHAAGPPDAGLGAAPTLPVGPAASAGPLPTQPSAGR